MSRSAAIALASSLASASAAPDGPICIAKRTAAADAQNPTALVQNQDLAGQGTNYNQPPTTDETILGYTQSRGYTDEGEMFAAQYLAETAAHFGYKASIYNEASLDDIYRMVDIGHPAIIGFDVDGDGNPADKRGLRAHYAVIEGHFEHQGTSYVVARHGWGTQTDYLWKASDLLASMKNLKYTDFYASNLREPPALHLPSPGRGFYDISASLGDTIIEVAPQGSELAGGTPVSAAR